MQGALSQVYCDVKIHHRPSQTTTPIALFHSLQFLKDVLKMNMSEVELERIFSALDTDTRKSIDFKQFKRGIRKHAFLKVQNKTVRLLSRKELRC